MAARTIPLNAYVEDLRQALNLATLNFDIWWTYKQRRDRARFVGVLNNYPLFFQTSLHAHFAAMIVSLYRIYETRTDTLNLSELMRRVEAEGVVSGRTLAGLKRRVSNSRKLWVKVSILRNEAFGHRINIGSIKDVFSKANVTANHLRSLIRRTKEISNVISKHLDKTTHAFNARAANDTRRLLADLKGLSVRSNHQFHRTRSSAASRRTARR